MNRVYLASRSPARLRMLLDAGVSVEPCATQADEAELKRRLQLEGVDALGLAQHLAIAKALGSEAEAGSLILGADQTLEIDGEILDKPGDVATLRRQLQRLAGRAHRLHAAVAFCRSGSVVWQGASTARLSMRPMNERQLDEYVAQEGAHVLDCVGGYRIEGRGAQLFEMMDGDYFSVLGLPLLQVLGALRELGASS